MSSISDSRAAAGPSCRGGMLYEEARRRQAHISCSPKEHTPLSLTMLMGDSRALFKKNLSESPCHTHDGIRGIVLCWRYQKHCIFFEATPLCQRRPPAAEPL